MNFSTLLIYGMPQREQYQVKSIDRISRALLWRRRALNRAQRDQEWPLRGFTLLTLSVDGINPLGLAMHACDIRFERRPPLKTANKNTDTLRPLWLAPWFDVVRWRQERPHKCCALCIRNE